MADDDIDIEGEFDFKIDPGDGLYDANELPSKSANLLPEYTNPPWMLEQGWSLDNCMDEKSKATIERMLLEEQQYMNGHKKGKYLGINKSVLLITASSPSKAGASQEPAAKRQWTDEEKKLFLKGLEQFGRSWSKISRLIPTRTTVQVKNYAQQFMKNQAKKAEQQKHTLSSPTKSHNSLAAFHYFAATSSSSSSHLDADSSLTLSPSSTFTSSSALLRTAETVTTAQPTVVARSHPPQPRPKPGTSKTVPKRKKTASKTEAASRAGSLSEDVTVGKRKKSTSTATHTKVPSLGMYETNDIESVTDPIPATATSDSVTTTLLESSLSANATFLPIGDIIHGQEEVQITNSSFTVKSELPCVEDNISVSCSAETNVASNTVQNVSLKVEKSDDNEGSDVDIDIENDDSDDENVILQSRSASPSSVYYRLLQQANVTGKTLPTTTNISIATTSVEPLASTQSISLQESDSEDLSNGSAHDSYASNSGGESNDQWTVNSESQSSSANNSQKADTWASGLGDDSNSNSKDDTVLEDTKPIVNGVVSASGEVLEFPIPIEAKDLQPDQILEEEKKVHAEFFDGRPLKTPERYLKIRNYILDCWRKCGPSYLNKTSVRPGLKNCGDVNCIGRIHAYLECIGAINFGCEQAAYNNPGRGTVMMSRSKGTCKEHHHHHQPYLSAAKLEAMRPRRRRIRDASGHWVDEKELEGKTIEHKPDLDDGSRSKSSRGPRVVYDPFKLVPCQPFADHKQAPYTLEVTSTALAVMDIHAHISRTEVIGMLGGHFDDITSCLTVSMAVPCKSISTGMQCEMDPVSQTLASEQIEDVGMFVVGWYHSHPTFAPNPSVRDIETQQKFQYWFAKGGSHFVGMIISPYSPQNSSVISDIRCLTIGDDIASDYLCNRPYQLQYEIAFRDNLREILGPASELAEKYANYNSRVALSCVYKPSLGITCLSKMLQSVKHRLESPDPEHPIPGSRRKVEDVLHWLEQIFLERFSSSSSVPGASSPLIHSDMNPLDTTPVLPNDDDEQV